MRFIWIIYGYQNRGITGELQGKLWENHPRPWWLKCKRFHLVNKGVFLMYDNIHFQTLEHGSFFSENRRNQFVKKWHFLTNPENRIFLKIRIILILKTTLFTSCTICTYNLYCTKNTHYTHIARIAHYIHIMHIMHNI